MVSPILTRARRILSLDEFRQSCAPIDVGPAQLQCPHRRQYVLRMIVRHGHSDYRLPDDLLWVESHLRMAHDFQHSVVGIRHLCCYITVRHGEVTSTTDDVLHTDGFSTRISHLPEQNYVVASCHPTQFFPRTVSFPSDFDPLVHNVHTYIQRRVDVSVPIAAQPHRMYCMDPYIIHRRPPEAAGTHRTFLRISYVPIEIMDDMNTPNPLLPMPHYGRNGVAIRGSLLDYDVP